MTLRQPDSGVDRSGSGTVAWNADPADARVGYEVTITPDEVYDGMEAYTRRWRVDVTRLSDGEQRTRFFGWRWRARRFAHSPRRLSHSLERPLPPPDRIERFIVEWK